MHWPRRVTRGLCWLWLVLWVTGTAQAAEHITARGWLQDGAGGSWGLADVREQPLQPFDGLLSLGYGPEVVWVRLQIDPAVSKGGGSGPDEEGLLYLRVRPPILDSVWLFDPLQGEGPMGPLGDRHPLAL